MWNSINVNTNCARVGVYISTLTNCQTERNFEFTSRNSDEFILHVSGNYAYECNTV